MSNLTVIYGKFISKIITYLSIRVFASMRAQNGHGQKVLVPVDVIFSLFSTRVKWSVRNSKNHAHIDIFHTSLRAKVGLVVELLESIELQLA